jgi:hypothetical protein
MKRLFVRSKGRGVHPGGSRRNPFEKAHRSGFHRFLRCVRNGTCHQSENYSAQLFGGIFGRQSPRYNNNRGQTTECGSSLACGRKDLMVVGYAPDRYHPRPNQRGFVPATDGACGMPLKVFVGPRPNLIFLAILGPASLIPLILAVYLGSETMVTVLFPRITGIRAISGLTFA